MLQPEVSAVCLCSRLSTNGRFRVEPASVVKTVEIKTSACAMINAFLVTGVYVVNAFLEFAGCCICIEYHFFNLGIMEVWPALNPCFWKIKGYCIY